MLNCQQRAIRQPYRSKMFKSSYGRAHTVCSHSFGPDRTRKQSGSFIWSRHMWSSFLILYCNLKCSNDPFTWSTLMVYGPRTDQNLVHSEGQNPESQLVIMLSCTKFRKHLELVAENWLYRNDPKFSDRQIWANSADPDQRSSLIRSTLFAIPSASFGLITLW